MSSDPLEALRQLARRDLELQRLRRSQVRDARAKGASWEDFKTARQIWDRIDVTDFDRTPSGELVRRTIYGRYLAAVGQPGAIEELERSIELAHQFDWPQSIHGASSELAAVHAQLGDPGEPTQTDDELLLWSRRLADQLIEPAP